MVSPQDRRWLEAHVGQGLRWPSTTALLADAIVFLRDLEAQEGNVRQEFLHGVVQELHRQQLGGRPQFAPASTKMELNRSSAPSSGALTSAKPGGRGLDSSDSDIPTPSNLEEIERIGWLWSDQKEEQERLHRAAVEHRDWQLACDVAALLGRFDQIPRLIFEGPQGRIYQQGRQRLHEATDDSSKRRDDAGQRYSAPSPR